MTQQQYERYPDTTVPVAIPLPAPPSNADEAVRYLRILHQWLAANQARTSEIYRLLSYHRNTVSTDDDSGSGGGGTGGTDNMPPASGAGVEHVDVDKTTGRARFFVDLHNALGNPEWFEVMQLASEVPVDTSGFGGVLGPTDDSVQEALDTIDDHTHTYYDPNAIHDDEASEIFSVALKATPAANDVVLIEDSADSYNKKRATVGSLASGSGLSQAQVLTLGLGA